MLLRVAEAGKPAFQLRPGEDGVSVFDPDSVDPPLSDLEILQYFRAGSVLLSRTEDEIIAKGLTIVSVEGAAALPQRLRDSHAEIQSGPNMSRAEFKRKLKEFE